MKRIIICLIFILSCISILAAEESWQGNAAVAHQGEFGTEGLYAASNSFPENTIVKVLNPRNGKSTSVTIKKRIEGSTGLFLLLSENAAVALGMGKTDIIPVETMIIGISNDLTGDPTEFVYNPDTDINPSAGTPTYENIRPDTAYVQPDTTYVQPDTTQPDVTQPDVIVTEARDPHANRNPQKDLFSTPHSDTELSINDRKTPDYDASSTKVTKLDDPKVKQLEKGDPNSIVRPSMPDDDVVAILVEPVKTERERAEVSSVRRPDNDFSGPEVALLDAELRGREIPTVEEIQRLDREREEIALTDHKYPDVRKDDDRASVEERTIMDREREELALKDPNYPQLHKGDKASVEERILLGADREELALSDPDYPQLHKGDKASVEERILLGPDREELALNDPNYPQLHKGETASVEERTLLGTAREEFALKDHNYPEIREGEKASVEERTLLGTEREEFALKDHRYPEVKDRERASVDERRGLDSDYEEFVMKDHTSPEIKPKDKVVPDTVIPDTVDRTARTTTRTELALVPAGPRPPSADSDVYSPRTTTPVLIPENLESLAKRNYYLQLGVYKTRAEAEKVAGLHRTYPMEIITATINDYSVYKVVVGPLKKDESGTVMFLFKADGYKDAFIRYVE